MGLFNKQEHDDQCYEKRIEELENEVASLKADCLFWQVSSNRRYDKINELKDKIKTMKSIITKINKMHGKIHIRNSMQNFLFK